MISYKFLIILPVIFVIGYCHHSKRSIHIYDEQVKKYEFMECMNTFLTIGFCDVKGFLNYIFVMQFKLASINGGVKKSEIEFDDVEFKESDVVHLYIDSNITDMDKKKETEHGAEKSGIQFNDEAFKKHIHSCTNLNITNIDEKIETGYIHEFYDQVKRTKLEFELHTPEKFCKLEIACDSVEKCKNNIINYTYKHDTVQKTYCQEKDPTSEDFRWVHKKDSEGVIQEYQLFANAEIISEIEKASTTIVEKYYEDKPYKNLLTSYKLSYLRDPETGDFLLRENMNGDVHKYYDYHLDILRRHKDTLKELIPYYTCESATKIETTSSDVNQGIPEDNKQETKI